MRLPSILNQVGACSGLLLLSMALADCGSAGSANDMGAMPGGAQDEALAKEKIASGEVPKPEDITVEGMLASHDLPLEAPRCTKPLCISSAYAVAPTLDYANSAVFVQMGFASGIDEATFRRAPLNLSVVVDRSGSMAGEKLAAVKTALGKLISHLNADDRLSIVLFDDRVDVLLPSTKVADKQAIGALISKVFERGSTNLSAGLKAGFAQVEEFAGSVGVSDRVIVLTDAIANTGSTDTESFIALASKEAENNVGLTVFGVGTDLNQELVLAISKLRGGNYSFLSDYERIATVFDQDFDYLVTPLAYNLKFTLTPATGFGVRSVYGFPSWSTAAANVEIDVATVFLSRGHGAIVARLEPKSGWPTSNTPLANLSLSYEPADGGENASDVLETIYDGNDPLGNGSLFYSQTGVRRTVAYVNAALGEKQACSSYWEGNQSEALAMLDKTKLLLVDEAAATEDSGLTTEAELIDRLRMNMTRSGSAYASDVQYDNGDDVVGPLACSLGRSGATSSGWLGAGSAILALGIARTRRRRRSVAAPLP